MTLERRKVPGEAWETFSVGGGGGGGGGGVTLLGPFSVPFDLAGVTDPNGAELYILPAGSYYLDSWAVFYQSWDQATNFDLRVAPSNAGNYEVMRQYAAQGGYPESIDPSEVQFAKIPSIVGSDFAQILSPCTFRVQTSGVAAAQGQAYVWLLAILP